MKRKILKNKDGATLAYVALALAVMLGVVGLSFDLGRHYILSLELQKAADAAAIAGGYQLDPLGVAADVADKVDAAVDGAPITGNSSRLANSNSVINIADVSLLKDIPSDDSDPITSSNVGPPYNYVSVTTEAKVSNNVFGRIIGQPASVTLTATAVARRGSAICQVTPLAVCNPAEAGGNTGASFNVNDYIGKEIIVRAKGNGPGAWAPGDFGFLDVPGFGNGAPGLAESLATANVDNCYNVSVTTKPGQTDGARNGINTRFGIYLNPMFGGEEDNSNYPPAENVRKGYDTTDVTDYCGNQPSISTDPNFLKYPRDTNLPPDEWTSGDDRFGNGTWDCEAYFTTVHPSESVPDFSASGGWVCGDTSTNTALRWDIYRYEIDNNLLNAGGTDTTREAAAPICNGAGNPAYSPPADDLYKDRRVVTMAVLNCDQYSVQGQWTGPAETFLNGFLAEPMYDTDDIVIEVIGGSAPGAGGPVPVVARDWVEIVR